MLLSFSVETPVEFSEVFEKLEDIFYQLHQCHHLEDLLQCGVQQTRQLFGCDRALVYQFTDDGDGAVTAESVSAEWSPTLGQLIYDPCFESVWGAKFQRGELTAIANVEQADLDPCYRDLMDRLQIKANLVSPILIQPATDGVTRAAPELWGLLIVHQCGEPRPWELVHIRVIKQIADQMGIALRHLRQTQTLARHRQDEMQWQAAVETAGCGVWQWRIEADEVRYSRHWQQLLGYGDREARPDLITSLEKIHPDDRERVYQALQQHLEGHTEVYRSEYRLRCRDGSWKWVCSQGQVTQRRRDGRPWCFVGLLMDISDRQQREQALQQRAQREQALNEVTEAIRSSLDVQQVFEVAATQIAECLQSRVRISKYVEQARCWRAVAVHSGPYGWSEAQQGQIWADVPDVDNPISAQLKQHQIVQIEDAERISAADTVNHPLAQQFAGQWLIVPIAAKTEVWGAVSLTRPVANPWESTDVDLIQRIAAQLAIAIDHADLHQQTQTAYERDALVLNSINEGIWDWNPVTGLDQVSDRYWQILGYEEPPTPPPRLPQELARVHPADRAAVTAAVSEHFATGARFEHELRLQHRRGHYIWVRLRGRALWNATGQPVRMLGSVEDISTRKSLEIRLRQQEKEFRTLVENNPDGIMRVDRQFRVLYANPIMQSRLGGPQTALVGQTLAQLGLPRTLTERWQTAISRVFETGQEQLLETQEYLPLGEHIFYSRIVPEFDNVDRIISVLIISRNVTNLRAAQVALQQQVQQEHALRLITQHIRATLDLDRILSTAVTEVQRSLQADRTIIVRLSEAQSRQIIAEAVQPPYPAILNTHWDDEALMPECLDFYRSGQGRIVPDIAQDDCEPDLVAFLQGTGVKSTMVAPIIQSLAAADMVWGLLVTHACAAHRHWQPDELNLLQKVAEQLAIAIQQSELHQRLQAANEELARISTTDALTQIANRRYFDDTLDREWQRAQREQRELALILCDIDWFKPYNDTYGHPAGDACIAAVAQALQQCINRATDCLARYGGEEFAVILPHTDVAGATVIVEQMRHAIANLDIAHPLPQTNSRLTLSYGISSIIPRPSLTLHDLINWADQALYQAKQAGRDRYAIVTGS